jgi:hypothetical protein
MHMTNLSKKTISRRAVKYSALSSGTVSAVWYDEDHAQKSAAKRQNRIVLQREKAEKPATPHYDA